MSATATVLLTLTLIGETTLSVKPSNQGVAYKHNVVKQCQYMAKDSEIHPHKVLTTYVPKGFKCERTIKL